MKRTKQQNQKFNQGITLVALVVTIVVLLILAGVSLNLVIGNEGKGIGEKVKKNCDFLVKIPMKGKVTSLNASVSAGIVMYEVVKQRK